VGGGDSRAREEGGRVGRYLVTRARVNIFLDVQQRSFRPFFAAQKQCTTALDEWGSALKLGEIRCSTEHGLLVVSGNVKVEVVFEGLPCL
jgi:hypothetical protein